MTCSSSDGSVGGGCEGLRIRGRVDGLRCLGGRSAGVVPGFAVSGVFFVLNIGPNYRSCSEAKTEDPQNGFASVSYHHCSILWRSTTFRMVGHDQLITEDGPNKWGIAAVAARLTPNLNA
eukprot:6004936-Amphidinium_carterae.1